MCPVALALLSCSRSTHNLVCNGLNRQHRARPSTAGRIKSAVCTASVSLEWSSSTAVLWQNGDDLAMWLPCLECVSSKWMWRCLQHWLGDSRMHRDAVVSSCPRDTRLGVQSQRVEALKLKEEMEMRYAEAHKAWDRNDRSLSEQLMQRVNALPVFEVCSWFLVLCCRAVLIPGFVRDFAVCLHAGPSVP